MMPYVKIQSVILSLFACLLLSWALVARADFTSVTVIGDSFSDGGNHKTAVISHQKLHGFPNASENKANATYYFDNKFSNFYVAVEYLAHHLGLFDKAHFFNFSVGGMKSKDLAQVIDFMDEIQHRFDPTGLYVIEIGQNDLLHRTENLAIITDRIVAAMQSLHNRGAQHFMVVNSLMIGSAPVNNAFSLSKQRYLNEVSLMFNQMLVEKVNALPFKQQITVYDLGGTVAEGSKIAHEFGITDIEFSCIQLKCTDPNRFLWLDSVHLSNIAHAAIGHSMYMTVAPNAP